MTKPHQHATRLRVAVCPNSSKAAYTTSGHPINHRGHAPLFPRRLWVCLLLIIPVFLAFVRSDGLSIVQLLSNLADRIPPALVAPQAPRVERAVASRLSASSIPVVNEQHTVATPVVDLTPAAPATATLLVPVVTLLPWSAADLASLPIGLVPWLTATVGAPAALVMLPTTTPEPPTPLPASLPTPTPTPSPLPTTAPVALEQPVQSFVELTGFRHYWQTWNNCGPATLAMNLSYYGGALDQSDIGRVLRTHEDDKNVKPEELVNFARSQGFQAAVRVNGNADLLRRLVSNGIPVLIETWVVPEPDNGLGHYRLITGYNDAEQYWIAYDSLMVVTIAELDSVASTETQVDTMNRRELFTYAWGAALALLTLEAGVGSFAFLYPRFRVGEFGGKFFLPPSETPTPDQAPKLYVDGKFWLITTAENQPKALYVVCPHLGCLYKWVSGNARFECPCHGSKYTHDGFYIEGPAPRSLDSFPITLAAGQLVVDTGEKILGSPSVESPARIMKA